ncbi:hypothetical protein MRB53_018268 [Persea americana]|uniref:Uncharacterized protein n=1 Tax=Persea americana TaxID=3435 RepID=A0ACC2M7B4_PERAE|nr:hypothetical protein MRB53_018268 [Persea americana]
MSQPKQVPLNGAYYGPPIPSQQAPHQPHRGCCLLSALIKFMAVFIIVSGITTVVLWIILSPSNMTVHVEKASLMQFNLTNGATLNYNLTLEMSVRNPNKKIGVYYDRMEARAYYDGYRFGFVPLPTFYQENKNTTTLYPVFHGQSLVALEDYTVQYFNREMNDGFFYIDVMIYGRTSFKIRSYRTKRYKSKFECELRVPLVANGSLGNGFRRTGCEVDIW